MRKLVLIFLSLLFTTLTAWADLPDDAGIKFRYFTHKFVEATNPLNTLDVSTYQMVKLSDYFEKNPTIIEDFLAGKNINTQAGNYIANEIKPGATITELVSEMVENRNNKIRNLIIENTEIVKWIA